MPSNMGKIIALAIKVCAIDVLESISIAKALAYRNQYELKCAPSFPCAQCPISPVTCCCPNPLMDWTLKLTVLRVHCLAYYFL